VIELPDLKIISTSQLTSKGTVWQIARTKRGSKDQSEELCIATSKGMFFGKYDGSYSFVENSEEFYFKNCVVPSFFEYDLDKFVCAVFNDPNKNYIQLINRSKKEETTKV